MIYEFKSKATGNLIMTQTVGDQVLNLIGKRSPKGVITVVEMPTVIGRLRAAMRAEQTETSANTTDAATNAKADDRNPSDHDTQPAVSLSQRLVPFIEMLERSHAAEKDIVWGV